ncbi:MAG: hypothetical protein DRH15_00685 [Deltaproteobacteria bacterium]|nr:MAG: hypothetical protein DRH15_00685 [Deltaproteobacteria bacterium]
MGEIRSTLDIIMEKARKLEVTEEEKTEIQRKETVARAKGMVQKYLDGLLQLKEMMDEIENMEPVVKDWAIEAIRNECRDRIDPEKDNSQLLLVLERVLGLDTKSLKELIELHREDLSKEAERIKQQMELELRAKGIRGTAVVINHRASPDWATYREKLRRKFKEKVRELL